MDFPAPTNGEEAGYIAAAAIDELLNLLVRKGVIDKGDTLTMFGLVAKKLAQSGNSGSHRAAKVIAQWVNSQG